MLEALTNVFGWVGNIVTFFLNLELLPGIKLYGFIFISYLVGALLVLLLNDAGTHVKVSGTSAGNVTKGSKGK